MPGEAPLELSAAASPAALAGRTSCGCCDRLKAAKSGGGAAKVTALTAGAAAPQLRPVSAYPKRFLVPLSLKCSMNA